MKFAYADPPYIGQASRHYGPTAKEVNHRLLIEHLHREYPDGWALSLSSPTLSEVLSLCPPGWRVAAWCKSFASFKPGVNPAFAWEPVIFYGGRKRGREADTVRDWLIEPITLQRGVHGAKPYRFCEWILDLLGVEAGDTFDDLFPGTGIMGKAALVRIMREAVPCGSLFAVEGLEAQPEIPEVES